MEIKQRPPAFPIQGQEKKKQHFLRYKYVVHVFTFAQNNTSVLFAL